MVSVTQLEGECPFLKQNFEHSKCHQVPLRGIRTHVYLFGATAKVNDEYLGFPEEQSLLESLILSQWEDRAWKGHVNYDVTTCDTKVVVGEMKFITQLNENLNPNPCTEFEGKTIQPLGFIESSYTRSHKDDMLFCVANGLKETSELIPSTMLPKDGILIIINANPFEYGHIFLIPYGTTHQSPGLFDKRTFELVARMAIEVNSCSFCIFYEYNASTSSNHVHFQATYFANPFPVELVPTILVYGNKVIEGGLCICEVADYPIKALVLMSKNVNALVEVVAEICSTLQDCDTAFNLLISAGGKKMFLFPQVGRPEWGHHLTTWECGGYFVYDAKADYERVSEMEILERMARVSLDDKEFQALKQLCCGIALQFTP